VQYLLGLVVEDADAPEKESSSKGSQKGKDEGKGKGLDSDIAQEPRRPFLQSVFERLVLAGGVEAYTLVAKHLAQDPRIDVNGHGCGCSQPPCPSILEVALDYQHVEMIRMLVESGRLQADYQMMRLRLDMLRSEDGDEAIWEAAGDYNDRSRDQESIVDSIVENLGTREQTVSKFIMQQGWQSMPFCTDYLTTYRKAIEDALGDDIAAICRWVRWES